MFVVPADGSGPAEQVAPDLDRPVVLFPGLPSPLDWVGNRDLLVLIADHGSVGLHRARVGERRSRVLISGDILIDGIAAHPGRRAVAYTSSWPDRPSELRVTTTAGVDPMPLTDLNAELLAEVELAPAGRSTIARPDGTEVEYFTIMTADRAWQAGLAARRHPRWAIRLMAIRPLAGFPSVSRRRGLRRGAAQPAREHELRPGLHAGVHR